MTSAWSAAHNSFKSKIRSFEQAVFFEGFYAILTAGWSIAASGWKHWRDQPLVQTNEKNPQKTTDALHAVFESILKWLCQFLDTQEGFWQYK